MAKNKYLLPLAFIGMMFFTVGFATGINGYFVPFLENNLSLTSAQSYLVIAATFTAFLVFSFPASTIIGKIGYKKTMSLSFFLFALAFALFIPAARLESFAIYLLACFISGTANTVLQAAINPYVTILGPIDSAARRISIMGICNSLALSLPSIFIAAVTRKPIEAVGLNDLDTPLYIIIAVVVVLGIITLFAPLEEIKAQGEENEEDCPYAAGKKSIWQFPHLILGALALFVYVGVENLALLTVLDYAQGLGLSNPESYTIWPGIGMAVGYVDFALREVVRGKGYAICFLPAVTELDSQLVKTPLFTRDGIPVTRNTWMIYRLEKKITPVMDAFIRYIEKHYKVSS